MSNNYKLFFVCTVTRNFKFDFVIKTVLYMHLSLIKPSQIAVYALGTVKQIQLSLL